MKRICILCDDSNIDSARENTRKIFNTTAKTLNIPLGFPADKIIQDYLSIPVSETGKEPVQKWFCFMNTNDEAYKKILDNNKYSIIEESGPKEFLEKWNLTIIK
jgi:hypothetical protein